MPFRFTNIHMTAPPTPAPVDPWAYPKASTSASKSKKAAPSAARPRGGATVIRPPPRSSSLRGPLAKPLDAAAIAAFNASKPPMKLIPLSVANSRDDIKYRKEAFEVEERAMHLAFMRYALRA